MPTSSEIQWLERVKNKTNDSESEKQEHLPKMGCENSTEFLLQMGFRKESDWELGLVPLPQSFKAVKIISQTSHLMILLLRRAFGRRLSKYYVITSEIKLWLLADKLCY